MNYFSCNGKYYKEGTAIIGASSRGLRYGDGLFETIKYHNGKLLLADEHFARLWKGMQVLRFEIPKHFTPDTLEQEIQALVQKNGHKHDVRVRLTVCRGDGGLYDPSGHIPQYIIQSLDLPESNGSWNSNGLVMGIYEEVRKSCDILSNLKHNNYLPYVMGALHAKKQKWNDAVIFNTAGRICDSTIANIFLVKDGIVLTPPLAEGCVAGVMRNHLLRQLPAMQVRAAEKELSVDELLNADEVFLTNAIYNIRWVQCIGDTSYGNSLTQQIFAALLPTIS